MDTDAETDAPVKKNPPEGSYPASPAERPEADPALRGSPPCLHLDLGLSGFRTERI